MHRAVLLPSSNSAKISYREGGHGHEYLLSVLSTFHVRGCSSTLPTNSRQTHRRSISSLRGVTGTGKSECVGHLFSTLPRHTTWNTVCWYTHSNFFLACPHAHLVLCCHLKGPAPINFSTHARRENSDDRAVGVCSCFPSIGVRREKSLGSLANAGQTWGTRTRVVKHTFAPVDDEDRARQSVLKLPTRIVPSSLRSESG